MPSGSGDGRLDELERRIRRIEASLGIERIDFRAEPPEAAEPSPPDAPSAPVIQPPPLEWEAPLREPEAPAEKASAPTPTEPQGDPSWPRLHRRRAAEASPRAPLDLERTIGARWFAAAGAVVVVIGVGLFLKLAIDRGWMNLIPPAWKCAFGALFGTLLLAAGEVIRRRLGALASAGVSAAGLGALFASVYAAYGVYHLVPPGLAFAMLAAVAMVGFAVAALGRLVSIAVLSLVAAYVNPVIIGDTGTAPLVLPAYLFALLCLGLALSAWRAAPFRPLRGLVWWGTLIFGTLWTRDQGLEHPGPALTFFAGCWAVLHTELALSAAKGRTTPETTLELPWPAVRFVATSFSTTVWSVALAIYVLRRGTSVHDWVAPAIAASITVAIGAGLAGRLRVLREMPRTDLERLGAGLAMQSGALTMTAIALGLSGWMEAVAWLSLGVAAVGAGRWIRSRGLDVYGFIALVVATGRLLFVDSPTFTGANSAVIVAFAGLVITRWTMLMVAGAGAWAAASMLLRRPAPAADAPRSPWLAASRGALVVALCHLNISLLSPDADHSSVAVAWLGLGLFGLGLGRWLVSPGLGVYGAAVLSLSTLRFAADAPILKPRASITAEFAGIVFSRWMALMLGAAAAWGLGAAAAPVWSPQAKRWRPIGEGSLVLALVLIALALVHPRADAGSVCTVWLVLGLTGLLAGRGLRSGALVVCGLFLLAAASARFLFGAPITGGSAPILAQGLGLIITRWSLLMLGGAAAWLIGAALLREPVDARPGGAGLRPASDPQRTVLVGIGVAMIYVSFLDPRAEPGSVSLAWLALGAACLLLHALLRRLALDAIGLVGLVLSTAAWTAAYPLDWTPTSAPLGFHPGLWTSLVIAAVAIAGAAWLRRVSPRAPLTVPQALGAMLPAALALLFASTSLEIARLASTVSEPTARKAAVSIWWGLVAVALILAGFILRRPIARHAGLALLALATFKAAAFDLQEVPQLWRVISFVGLGLLMLGVAVGYARASSLLREASPGKAP